MVPWMLEVIAGPSALAGFMVYQRSGTVRPVELTYGPNLPYLLGEHADNEARIVTPADWKDSAADIPQEDS